MRTALASLVAALVIWGLGLGGSENTLRELTRAEARRLVELAACGELDSEQHRWPGSSLPQQLFLDALQDLPQDVAAELALHRGDLSLKGITHLKAEVAAALIGERQARAWGQAGSPSIFFSVPTLALDGLADISVDTAVILSGYCGSLSLAGLKSLSLETATALAGTPRAPQGESTKFVERRELRLNGLQQIAAPQLKCLVSAGWLVSLPGLKSLDTETASVLVKQDGSLSLDGLTTLSAEVAKILARNEHEISLKGLTRLPADVAEVLAEGSATLVLAGISEMSIETARALRSHRGQLILDGVMELPPSVADELAMHDGSLEMAGIRVFNSPALAGKLSWSRGEKPSLCSITPEEVKAIEFARSNPYESEADALYLKCDNLTVPAAESLSLYRGDISLELQALSADVARVLAAHDGFPASRWSSRAGSLTLSLRTDISATVAEELKRCIRRLELKAPNYRTIPSDSSLSPTSNVAFVSTTSAATSVSNLTSQLAKELAQSESEIRLDQVAELDASTATELARHRGDLYLDGVKKLSTEVAEALAKHLGNTLSLNGVKTLSPEAERALARGNVSNLSLESLRHLETPELAEAFCEATGAGPSPYTWGIGLQTVSAAAAREIAKWDCSELAITVVSPDVAAALAACEGDLGVSVSELDVESARILADREGNLNLDALESLSPEIAKALSACRGNLSLRGLTSLDAQSAQAVCSHGGRLDIWCQEELSAETLAALTKHKGDLGDLGPSPLLDPVLVGKIVFHENYPMSCCGGRVVEATALSPQAAAMLVKSGTSLQFPNLRTLPPDVATELARSKHPLEFGAIHDLDQKLAKALAEHDGYLVLDNVRGIPTDAAAALANHKGGLSMEGLERLAESSLAAKLAQNICYEQRSMRFWTPEAVGSWSRSQAERQSVDLDGLHALDVEVADAMVRGASGASIKLGSVTELSLDVAEKLALHTGSLELPALVALQPDVAEMLSRGEGSLEVGVYKLTPQVARSLASRRGNLSLPRLGILTADVARELACHKGSLSFAGLSTMSSDAASALAPHKGDLWLRNVVALPKDSADVLAEHLGDVFVFSNSISRLYGDALSERLLKQYERRQVNGGFAGEVYFPWWLANLDSAAFAVYRVDGADKGSDVVSLDHVVEMSPKAQDAVAAVKRPFTLRGLRRLTSAALAARLAKDAQGDLGTSYRRLNVRELSPEAAKALAANTKALTLRLATLTQEVASALASQNGSLSVHAPDLGPDVVKILATHEGPLAIGHITQLSPELAKTFSVHLLDLQLEVNHEGLTPEAAGILAERRGSLSLDIKELTLEIASRLSQGAGDLTLNAVRDMSPEVAQSFEGHRGRLVLGGLQDPSPEVAEALARHAGPLTLNGLRVLASPALACRMAEDDEASLEFANLRSLTVDVARSLAKTTASLSFDSVRSIDLELARAFEDHSGTLTLNSIKAITPDVEDSLARHKGGIELDGLVKLTKGGLAAKFVKPSSDLTVSLYFDELRQLTPEAAAGLARHAGELWLNGLQTMSPEVAAALAKHKGELGLSGLEWISVAAAQAIAQHEGPVVLTGLKGVSPESRNALLSNPGIKVGDDTDR